MNTTKKETINLSLTRGGKVLAAPAGFLDRSFNAYRDACSGAGATYVRGVGNETDLDTLPALTRALEAAGFEARIHPDLRAAIGARAAALETALSADQAALLPLMAELKAEGRALYPYQVAGVSFLLADPRRGLFDDMGLGKTIQALAALRASAARKGAPVAAMVVCPAVAKGVWAREAKKWWPAQSVVTLTGKGSFRYPAAGELVILNYELLPAADDLLGTPVSNVGADVHPATFQAPAGVVVIFDELQKAKNPRSNMGKASRALGEAAVEAGGAIWGLTGTPFENNGGETHAILNVIGGLGDELFQGAWKAKWAAREKPAIVVGALRRCSLRRLKVQVLRDLPAKRRQDVQVQIDAASLRALDGILARMGGEEALARAVEAAAVSEATARAGVDFEELSRARAILADAKLPAALELIEQYESAGEPLVIMCDHLAPLQVIAAREGWALIDGSVAPEKRTAIEEAFQRGELKGVACSIRASGVALTLTHASIMLFLDSAWNPAKNAQAEDRIYRIGQDNAVLILRLVAQHVIDLRVAELCSVKEEQFKNTVDAASTADDSNPVAQAAAGLAALAASTPAPVPAAPAPSAAAPRANKYAGKCGLCGGQVAEGAGLLTGQRGSWGVSHKPGECPERVDGRRLTDTVRDAVEIGARRPAQNPTEIWAQAGLTQLAAMDPDHAQELNGVGFAKSDVGRGHQLATLAARTGLTEAGWVLAVSIARRYAGTQLSAPPVSQ